MATAPIRVPESVRGEVQTASRLLGCNASDLLARAWEQFRQSPEFKQEFELAQKAFSVGDLDTIARRLTERGAERAADRAVAVQRLRAGR